MKAPFPYFGGKSRIAKEVWRRFGEVTNFVEPFFGSGAVLLARPDFQCLETVNDIDAYISNFWRAMQAEPEALAEICDNPVNECDVEAWHKWLVTASRKAALTESCRNDPHFYDVEIAGRWCWGLCQWIGGGWCEGEWHGPGSEKNRGSGVNVMGGKRPHLLNAGRGVHRQLPHLADAGRGVHRQAVADGGQHPCSSWFAALAARLRRVRVCCGDWSRVCGPSVTIQNGLTAIFLDPPYSAAAGRDNNIYTHESGSVAHDVRQWCLDNGDNRLLRIALCGYEREGHEILEERGWEVLQWTAHGGYGLQNRNGDYTNKFRERIWFSPGCCREETLF